MQRSGISLRMLVIKRKLTLTMIDKLEMKTERTPCICHCEASCLLVLMRLTAHIILL